MVVKSTHYQRKLERERAEASDLMGETRHITSTQVGVPAMPRHFLGRADLLEELVAKLISGKNSVLAAEGLAGVGKTTLAVVLAHHSQVLAHFEAGILWAGLGSQPNVMGLLAGWARALGKDIDSLDDVEKRRQAVTNLIGQRCCLLVIDDVWDIELAESLRCGGPNCCHLLTTRNEGIARVFAGAGQSKKVEPLGQESSYKLLQLLAQAACQAQPESARALAQAVGGLPLALEVIGAYLDAPECNRFAQLCQGDMKEMADPAKRFGHAQTRLGSAQRRKLSLNETIALSLDGLPQRVKVAYYSLGAFAPQPDQFSFEAAQTIAQTDTQTLELLAARNMLTKESDEFLSLHPVLAKFTQTRIDVTAHNLHNDYYLAYIDQNREDLRRIEAVYGQARWAWRKHAEESGLLSWLWALMIYRNKRGLWQEDLEWNQRGLALARQQRLRKDEGAILSNIAKVYNHRGQPDKAFECYEMALPILREVGDLSGQASALGGIAKVYHNRGQRDEALDYYQQALPLLQQIGDRSVQAETLNNIGRIYYHAEQRDKALACYEQALPILQEIGNRSGELSTLNNIGRVYYNFTQLDKALECYQQALSISKELRKRSHSASILNNMGRVFQHRGQWDKALAYYEQALPIMNKVGDWSAQASTLNNIGRLFDDRGQRDKALTYYEQALALSKKVGDRFGLAATLNNIGRVHYNLGQRDKALTYYEQALPIMKQMGDRSGQASTLNNIGRVYYNFGQWDKALEFYEQALSLSKEVGNRSGQASTLNNIGAVYNALGQQDEALEHYEQALPIMDEVGDRSGQAATRNNIGRVYNALGQQDKALEHYEQALCISTNIGNRSAESIARFNMARVYRSLDRLSDAYDQLKQVVELDTLVNSPDLAADKKLLAEVEAQLAKNQEKSNH